MAGARALVAQARGSLSDSRGVSPAPVGMVLGAVTAVQFGAGLAVTLFADLGPVGTVLLRVGFAAIVLVIAWRPRIRGLTRREWELAAAFGVSLAVMNGLYYLAIDRIPQGVAVTFEFVGPLGVALAASRRGLDVVWAAMAAGGVALLGGGLGPSLDALGVVFALGAGAAWASYILLNARVGQAFAGGQGLALAMVFGTAILIVPGVIDAGGSLLDPDLLALGFGVALLSSVIPYSLELEALRRMPARVFGVLMSLEPGLAALAGFLVLGQDVQPVEAFAIALVVAASAGAARTAREPRPPVD
jgi:inner membrane transporter RhtA